MPLEHGNAVDALLQLDPRQIAGRIHLVGNGDQFVGLTAGQSIGGLVRAEELAQRGDAVAAWLGQEPRARHGAHDFRGAKHVLLHAHTRQRAAKVSERVAPGGEGIGGRGWRRRYCFHVSGQTIVGRISGIVLVAADVEIRIRIGWTDHRRAWRLRAAVRRRRGQDGDEERKQCAADETGTVTANHRSS
jgi:hypothetical protein